MFKYCKIHFPFLFNLFYVFGSVRIIKIAKEKELEDIRMLYKASK